jgi:signal transduction histidine kinase
MRSRTISLPGLTRVFTKIGSNSFLEPKSLLALVIPLMLITSVASSDPANPVNYLYWLIANVLALAVLAVPVLMLRWVWQRSSQDFVIPAPVAFFVSLAISFVKSLLTVLLVSDLAQIPLVDLDLNSRLVGGTIAGAVALLVASGIVLLLREFQAERALLLTAKTMDLVPAVTNSESKKLSQLTKGISSITQTLQAQAVGLKMELSILRELVDRYVRPLSSSLYSDLEQSYQSFSARELLRSSLRQAPPALALGLQYFIGAPRNIEWFGLQSGLAITLFGSLLIYLAFLLVGKIAPDSGFWSPTTFVLVGASIPLAIVLGLASLFSPGHNYSAAISLIMILWFGQGAIIFSMAKVALQSANRNRREVSKLVRVSDADAALALLRRNRKLMANQMHGEVQSRLMNLVLRAEAGNELERKVVIEELSAIQDLISSVRNQKSSFNQSLAELEQTWEGFANLTIKLSGLKVSTAKQELVFALIEEGVSNAVRHGLASEIDLRFEKPNILLIEDNGMGPTKGKPGLGSKLMSASGSWSLTPREEGGASLSIELNLE